jgi:hypothetical protein
MDKVYPILADEIRIEVKKNFSKARKGDDECPFLSIVAVPGCNDGFKTVQDKFGADESILLDMSSEVAVLETEDKSELASVASTEGAADGGVGGEDDGTTTTKEEDYDGTTTMNTKEDHEATAAAAAAVEGNGPFNEGIGEDDADEDAFEVPHVTSTETAESDPSDNADVTTSGMKLVCVPKLCNHDTLLEQGAAVGCGWSVRGVLSRVCGIITMVFLAGIMALSTVVLLFPCTMDMPYTVRVAVLFLAVHKLTIWAADFIIVKVDTLASGRCFDSAMIHAQTSVLSCLAIVIILVFMFMNRSCLRKAEPKPVQHQGPVRGGPIHA